MTEVKHFLVIEDDPDYAILIRCAFQLLSHCTALVCRNIGEAKAYILGAGLYADKIKYPLPQTIICDFKLPEENALHFLEWAAGQPNCWEIPIIILTGVASPKEMKMALSLGAKEVLQKPNDIETLKLMLSHLTQVPSGPPDSGKN